MPLCIASHAVVPRHDCLFFLCNLLASTDITQIHGPSVYWCFLAALLLEDHFQKFTSGSLCQILIKAFSFHPTMATVTPEEDEERRLRQVHQYLSLRDAQNEKRIEVTKVESPDTALTAFTQLVAWRMDAQRAIVSLVDRNDQVTPLCDVHHEDSDLICR